MNPSDTAVRVWCSPRADTAYPWKWAVTNSETRETLEFGAEETEETAKREATEAQGRISTMNPSGTTVFKPFEFGHYSREALENALASASNHPSDEVNRKYIVPLQEAYASAMAQRDRLLEALKRLLAAGIADPDEASEAEVKELTDAWRNAEQAISATQP